MKPLCVTAAETFSRWMAPFGGREQSITAEADLRPGKSYVFKDAGSPADFTAHLPDAEKYDGRWISLRVDAGMTKIVTVDDNGNGDHIMHTGEPAYIEAQNGLWVRKAGHSNPMRVRLSRAADESGLEAGEWGALHLTAKDFGITEMYDAVNGRIKFIRPGKYLAGSGAYVSGVASVLFITVAQTGTFSNHYGAAPLAGGAGACSFTYPFDCGLDDYLSLGVYQDGASAVAVGTTIGLWAAEQVGAW